MASWAEHAIWWHVYPLGFTGAEKVAFVPDGPVRHRLGHLEAWLGYAVDLGCSGLLDVAPAAMIGDIIDRDGGTLVASYQMAGDIGSVVGPVAGGFLVDSASYGAAFGLAAAVLGGAAILGSAAPETMPGPAVPAAGHAVTGPDTRVR